MVLRLDCAFCRHIERLNRGQKHINLTSISKKQKLPDDLSLFWNSDSNKTLLQQYFFNWMAETKSYGSKTIYAGGLEDGKCKKLAPNEDIETVNELYSKQQEDRSR